MAISGSDVTGRSPDLLSDCRLMLRFASGNGFGLSLELKQDIAKLDELLALLGQEPISAVQRDILLGGTKLLNTVTCPTSGSAAAGAASPAGETSQATASASAGGEGATNATAPTGATPAAERAVSRDMPSSSEGAAPPDSTGTTPSTAAPSATDTSSGTPSPAAASTPSTSTAAPPVPAPVGTPMPACQTRSMSELILRVHDELSVLIAPATALSLQTSEPPPRQRRLLGGMPSIVKWAMAMAFISALGFSASAFVIKKHASPPSEPVKEGQKDASKSAPARGEPSKGEPSKGEPSKSAPGASSQPSSRGS